MIQQSPQAPTTKLSVLTSVAFVFIVTSTKLLVPLILLSVYYVSGGIVFGVYVAAMTVPIVFVVLQIAFRCIVPVSDFDIDNSHNGSATAVLKRAIHDIFENSWMYEVYETGVCLGSCVVFVLFSYSVSYDNRRYVLETGNPTSFVLAETFFIASFGFDYMMGVLTHPSPFAGFVKRTMRIVDLLSFLGSAYFSILHFDIFSSENSTTYNFYLIQGCLRFLRLRRILRLFGEGLPTTSDSGRRPHLAVIHLSPEMTKLVCLLVKAVLVILFCASLVMAFEFPCVDVITHPEKCDSEMHAFHNCVAYVIAIAATCSTPFSCQTVGGRLITAALSLLYLLYVPIRLIMLIPDTTFLRPPNNNNNNNNNNNAPSKNIPSEHALVP